MRDDTTFNAFVDWVKTKPADETYSYVNPTNCAFSQFLKETGRATKPSCTVHNWHDRANEGSVRNPMDERLDYPDDAFSPLQAHTFGGILERLKENGHDV